MVQRAISIPEPTNNVDSLWSSVKAIKEAVETIQGIRGDREYALDSVMNEAINDLQVQINKIDVSTSAGATLTGVWQFDDGTGATDPGAGKLKFNNATIGSVTAIYINNETKPGVDVDNILSFLASGDDIYIQNNEAAGQYLLFDITSTVDNTGWWTLNGTVNESGSNITDGVECGVILLFGGT